MLATGTLAAALLIINSPSWQTALLLSIAIWGFCRAYYFAFYVIEHYIDSGYRFAGLTDFLKYTISKRPKASQEKLHSQRPIEPDHSGIDH